MSSKITRKNARGFGDQVRPSFTFNHHPDGTPYDSLQAQLLESLRNATEDVRQQLEFLNNKQMLQCDVRTDIKKMRIALEKIAKNTARRRRATKVSA